MYDLTPIAACSASIVAILGGFIASKLIFISTERNESLTHLFEINEEIAFHKKNGIIPNSTLMRMMP